MSQRSFSRFGAAPMAAAVLAVALVGCAGNPAESPQASDVIKEFDGTPAEWTMLFRACIEDSGLQTADLPDGSKDGFMISLLNSTQEFRDQVTAKCRAEIGEAPMTGLSTDELQRRYSARVSQFDCMVDLGVVDGEPISFEKFVDDYNRSGQKLLWAPGEGISVTLEDGTRKGSTDLCPLDPSVW